MGDKESDIIFIQIYKKNLVILCELVPPIFSFYFVSAQKEIVSLSKEKYDMYEHFAL